MLIKHRNRDSTSAEYGKTIWSQFVPTEEFIFLATKMKL